MCEKTGSWIEGEALMGQKLSRLLLTKKGSKPVIRDFGTNLRSLIDLPVNEFKIHTTQEIFQTIEAYAPEFLCHGIDYEFCQGRVAILLKGEVNRRKLEHALLT